MMPAQVHHLTEQEQAQAVASWGRGGSFQCIGCGREATDEPAPLYVPTPYAGIALGGCAACAKRWGQSAGFRRDVKAKARAQITRSLLQRTADLIGVPRNTMLTAMNQVCPIGHRPQDGDHARVDLALGLPAGSFSGAMLKVFGVSRGQQ